MLLAKLRIMVAMLLGAALVTTGLTVLAYSTLSPKGGPDPRQSDDQGTGPETKPAVVQGAAGQQGPERQTPEEELFRLLHEMDARAKAILAIKPGAERKAAIKQTTPDLDGMFGRFLDLATRHPRTDVAEQALIWLAKHTSTRLEVKTAREILARDHSRSDRLGSVFGPGYSRFHADFWKASEDLLRNALEQNPYVEVRALAAYWLADLLKDQAESLSLFTLDGPAEARRTLTQSQISADDVEWLLKKDPKQGEDEAVRLYE